LIASELRNTTLESSCAADVCLQLPFTTISSIGSEKTSVLKKEISSEIKKTNEMFLMMFMQFLRHYCMDQVQRVSVKISGQMTTPLQMKVSYDFYKKKSTESRIQWGICVAKIISGCRA